MNGGVCGLDGVLCADCRADIEHRAADDKRARQAAALLRSNEMLLRNAAKVLSEAGHTALAQQIRALV